MVRHKFIRFIPPPKDRWAVEGIGSKPSDNDLRFFRTNESLGGILDFNRDFVHKHYNRSYLHYWMFGKWRKVCRI